MEIKKSELETRYNAKVNKLIIDNDAVVIDIKTKTKGSTIARHILDEHPQIKFVCFTGGFVDGIYTRNTLARKRNQTK